MELQQAFDSAQNLTRSAGVKSVFGEPVVVGDRTVIPVARIAYGFGGGIGRGPQLRSESTSPNPEGMGMGGGVAAMPVGVIDISPAQTRFIGFSDRRKLGAALLAGFIVGRLLRRRRE